MNNGDMNSGERIVSEQGDKEMRKTRLRMEIEKVEESLHMLDRGKKYPGYDKEIERLQQELEKLKQEDIDLNR